MPETRSNLTTADNHSPDRDPLDRLVETLPAPMHRAIQWLRRPGGKWLRLPLGVVLIVCGLLGFLPVFGFWMIPLGVLLLVEDVPFMKPPVARAASALQAWFGHRRRHSPRTGP